MYECNNRGYPGGANDTVSWPAASPHVVAVGGTTLYTTSGGALSNETVWHEGLDIANFDKPIQTGGYRA